MPEDFTVADGTGIEKGTLLKLTDPRTAVAADAATAAAANPAAGIAAREKVANDGRTRLAVYRRGTFDCVASGAINIGAPVVFITDNYVAEAASTASGAIIAGVALETAADAETIQIDLRLD